MLLVFGLGGELPAKRRSRPGRLLPMRRLLRRAVQGCGAILDPSTWEDPIAREICQLDCHASGAGVEVVQKVQDPATSLPPHKLVVVELGQKGSCVAEEGSGYMSRSSKPGVVGPGHFFLFSESQLCVVEAAMAEPWRAAFPG